MAGRMLTGGDGDPLRWKDMLFLDNRDQPGDPYDLMYSTDGLIGEIGVTHGIYDIRAGTYESIETGFLGHVVCALDFTISSKYPGWWPQSENLLFEVLHPDSGTAYWSARGPFVSEPIQAYVEFPDCSWGFEVRLTVVPGLSPFIVLLSGLGLFACAQRRRG